ncbi:replication-relaxation family protein [Paenibacillus illinoisensis]|uniref:replication-relaxation family protein n=1 Tax=Paenibacillus illinoisensis TaxID=59845 RepID=UPI00301DF89B
MEHMVSPLINPEEAKVPTYPLLDDPYSYVAEIDTLTKHQYYYIERKIEQGWITSRDIAIVRFVFVHRWVTLSQIDRIFFPEAERENTARTRMKKLLKYGLLRKIKWTSYSTVTETRPALYEVGASGADVLKFRFAMFLGQRDPRHSKPTTMLFRMKYVAVNELYLQMREEFNLVHFEFHPILKNNDDQQVPTARFSLKNPSGKEVDFVLVCHREDENWLKTIRYQAMFYAAYKTVNRSLNLLVQVSTYEKAKMANNVFSQEGLESAWYITDDDLFDKTKNIVQSFSSIDNEGNRTYYDLGTR